MSVTPALSLIPAVDRAQLEKTPRGLGLHKKVLGCLSEILKSNLAPSAFPLAKQP